jgi:hypothetical protein
MIEAARRARDRPGPSASNRHSTLPSENVDNRGCSFCVRHIAGGNRAAVIFRTISPPTLLLSPAVSFHNNPSFAMGRKAVSSRSFEPAGRALVSRVHECTPRIVRMQKRTQPCNRVHGQISPQADSLGRRFEGPCRAVSSKVFNQIWPTFWLHRDTRRSIARRVR